MPPSIIVVLNLRQRHTTKNFVTRNKTTKNEIKPKIKEKKNPGIPYLLDSL
jgi:hypothetical protein